MKQEYESFRSLDEALEWVLSRDAISQDTTSISRLTSLSCGSDTSVTTGGGGAYRDVGLQCDSPDRFRRIACRRFSASAAMNAFGTGKGRRNAAKLKQEKSCSGSVFITTPMKKLLALNRGEITITNPQSRY